MNTNKNNKNAKNENQAESKAVQVLNLDDLDDVVGGSNPLADVPRTELRNLDEQVRTNA